MEDGSLRVGNRELTSCADGVVLDPAECSKSCNPNTCKNTCTRTCQYWVAECFSKAAQKCIPGKDCLAVCKDLGTGSRVGQSDCVKACNEEKKAGGCGDGSTNLCWLFAFLEVPAYKSVGQCISTEKCNLNPDTYYCFSGDSTVEVLNIGTVAMKDLSIGDAVKVNGGEFSEVYSFGHSDKDVTTSFLSIDAGFENPLTITHDHMVFVDNKAMPASSVAVGDRLSVDGGVATVLRIKNITATGVFAPITKDGTIVVDSVVASCYVSLQGGSHLVIAGVNTINMHSLAHILKASHRLSCEINAGFCASETYIDGISIWIEKPFTTAKWLADQNTLVMVAAFVPTLAFVVVTAAVESMIGRSPPVLLLIAAFITSTWFMARNKRVKKVS